MAHLHGFVEFCQLNEWYGVIDLGTLLIPNRALTSVLLDVARTSGTSVIPGDASIAFSERYDAIKHDASGTANLAYPTMTSLLREARGETATLFEETLFGVLGRLCDVMADRFGAENVRILAYAD